MSVFTEVSVGCPACDAQTLSVQNGRLRCLNAQCPTPTAAHTVLVIEAEGEYESNADVLIRMLKIVRLDNPRLLIQFLMSWDDEGLSGITSLLREVADFVEAVRTEKKKVRAG